MAIAYGNHPCPENVDHALSATWGLDSQRIFRLWVQEDFRLWNNRAIEIVGAVLEPVFLLFWNSFAAWTPQDLS